MRLRICRQPTGSVDGHRLDHFCPGVVYDVGTQLGNVFLAEGWAEPITDGTPVGSVRSPKSVAGLVLVVEDSPELRRAVTSLLAAHGYQVVEAGHGQEALARLCECAPALVILDLDMPVMDGWQFRAEQQRLADARLAAIPVVVFTGADVTHGDVAPLQAAGLLHKPFDPDRLLSAVETVLGA